MFNRFKIVAAIASCLTLASCDDLRDGYEDCGVWLDFIFDYHMDEGDTFGPGMRSVDVLVFDADGKYYSSQFATIDQLEGGKRLFLGDPEMPFGKYQVVTLAGLTEHFQLSDINGDDFVKGVTTIEDVKHELQYDDPDRIDHEFPHLWFGEPVEIDYKANLSVWPVPVIRQTNNFSVSYTHTLIETTTEVPNGGKTRAATDTPLHTVSIITPESGSYDYINDPLAHDPATYYHYSAASDIQDVENGEVKQTISNLNTMRLFAGHPDGYTLAIHENETGGLVWQADLIELLSRTRDGMPIQEYLDRVGEWNIVIEMTTTKEKEVIPPPPPPMRSDYISLRLIVNNWVLWDTGIGIGN